MRVHAQFCAAIWSVTTALSLIALSTAVQAQTALTPATTDILGLVPQDAIALVTLKPKELFNQESFRMMPLEVATAAGMQYLGVDPLKIERIDAMMGLPLGGMDNLPLAVMITHGEDIPQPLLMRLSPAGAKTEKGLEMWPIPNSPDMVIHLRSPRQAIVGARTYITRLLKLKQPDGDLRAVAKAMGEPDHVRLIVVLEQMRDLLVGLAQSPQLERFPIAKDVITLAEKTKLVAISMHLGEAAQASYIIQGETAADAMELSRSLSSLVKFAGAALIANMQQEVAQQEGRMPAATMAYIKRLLPIIEQKLTLKPEGNQLKLTLAGQELVVGQVGVLTGLLLPAVQAARNSARMMQSSNNLKQMILAILNFEAATKAICNDTATPIAKVDQKTGGKLSWRVKILPFMEAQQLYEEFHLDEDWDSPHNIKLLEKMPPYYNHPNFPTQPGYTVYQMASGAGMLNESGKNYRFRDITDGTSNTAVIVSTVPTAAVPWTKPDDFDPVARRAQLAVEGGNHIAAMLDGSVLKLVPSIRPEPWVALFTVNAGDEPRIPMAR